MHIRLLQVMPFPDDGTDEVQCIVRFSSSWQSLTELPGGRHLTRVPGTLRWSHGGGLFVEERSGSRFTVQSLWPIVDEPDFWPDGQDPDSKPDEDDDQDSGFTWKVGHVRVDPDAETRGAALDHAERRKAARARRRPRADPAERITVRLMLEYGADWPLWGPEGPLEPWELALSPELTETIRQWHALWDRSHDWEDGWTNADDRAEHERERPGIAEQLRQEIAAFADLEVFGAEEQEEQD
ncbi:hypothetical protein [Curtobacterium sp. ZW137]|uniref:hypothetical protein n=1 Tax=Curtobacterium sp. ZW137 TaxID=2485104 RepID=UPI000F4C094B|nr:hypothetical protein [Curtobacterium sp. ZW137]ROP65583.1 hypothetical protein EDF55_0018 [Curtobacterium sp. ZW137]